MVTGVYHWSVTYLSYIWISLIKVVDWWWISAHHDPKKNPSTRLEFVVFAHWLSTNYLPLTCTYPGKGLACVHHLNRVSAGLKLLGTTTSKPKLQSNCQLAILHRIRIRKVRVQRTKRYAWPTRVRSELWLDHVKHEYENEFLYRAMIRSSIEESCEYNNTSKTSSISDSKLSCSMTWAQSMTRVLSM